MAFTIGSSAGSGMNAIIRTKRLNNPSNPTWGPANYRAPSPRGETISNSLAIFSLVMLPPKEFLTGMRLIQDYGDGSRDVPATDIFCRRLVV
jgi:hypothetical protein